LIIGHVLTWYIFVTQNYLQYNILQFATLWARHSAQCTFQSRTLLGGVLQIQQYVLSWRNMAAVRGLTDRVGQHLTRRLSALQDPKVW